MKLFIKPTYYTSVEMLCGPHVNWIKQFSKVDPQFPVPHVTEIELYENVPDNVIRAIQSSFKSNGLLL
jgi:hypothetical protein